MLMVERVDTTTLFQPILSDFLVSTLTTLPRMDSSLTLPMAPTMWNPMESHPPLTGQLLHPVQHMEYPAPILQ